MTILLTRSPSLTRPVLKVVLVKFMLRKEFVYSTSINFGCQVGIPKTDQQIDGRLDQRTTLKIFCNFSIWYIFHTFPHVGNCRALWRASDLIRKYFILRASMHLAEMIKLFYFVKEFSNFGKVGRCGKCIYRILP